MNNYRYVSYYKNVPIDMLLRGGIIFCLPRTPSILKWVLLTPMGAYYTHTIGTTILHACYNDHDIIGQLDT